MTMRTNDSHHDTKPTFEMFYKNVKYRIIDKTECLLGWRICSDRWFTFFFIFICLAFGFAFAPHFVLGGCFERSITRSECG